MQETFCKAPNVAFLIVQRRDELLVRIQVPIACHTKWQANKYKASRCPIFSDMSVRSIRLLQTDSTGRYD